MRRDDGPLLNVDCGHCETPTDRCSDEGDRCCYRPARDLDQASVEADAARCHDEAHPGHVEGCSACGPLGPIEKWLADLIAGGEAFYAEEEAR